MMRVGLSFFTLLLLVSCTKEIARQHTPDLPLAHGVTIEINQRPAPKVTYLSKTPSPKRQAPWKPIKKTPQGFHVMMDTYGYKQGLPLDEINALRSDSLGNLWIGAAGNGARRYDGTGFSDINGHLKELGWVNSLLEDNNRNLWFGTNEGLTKYDGLSFVTYTQKDGLAGTVKCSLQDSRGRLWFGTNHGVSVFSAGAFQSISTPNGLVGNNVQALYEDDAGVLWIGTTSGLSRYDGKSFQNFTTSQNLVSDNVLSIGAEKSGTLWIGTDKGANKFDGHHFNAYTSKEGLADNFVTTIFRDRRDNLWFGTQRGLSQLKGNTFVNIGKDQGLCSNNVTALTDDANGNLWIGTRGSGICRYDGKAFINYTKAQGLPDLVWGFIRARSELLWIGTETNGVYSSDGKTWTQYKTEPSLVEDAVWALFEDSSGALWFGTPQNGVSKFDGVSLTTFTTQQGLADNSVKSIFQDSSGALWFGTNMGVSKFDGTTFINYTVAQGLAGNNIYGIIQDKNGNLWFSSNDGGISRYDGKSFTNFTTAQGLPTNQVYNILEDKAGILWITSDAGFVRYDGHSFLTYSTTQGLPDNTIFRAAITKDGNLLLGANEGLSLLLGFTPKTPTFVKASSHGTGTRLKVAFPAQNNLSNAELKNYNPIFETYSEKTGYPIIDTAALQFSLYRDWDDTFWNLSSSETLGISHIDLSAVVRSEAAPLLIIKAIDVNNENINWLSLLQPNKSGPMAQKFGDIKFGTVARFYPIPEGLVLPYIHNNVTIHFAAIEPALPEDVRYQVLLEGYDRGWGPVTDQLQASFGNIFEGTYTFKVRAKSPFGVWSEPTSYTFTVLPPWYRTWWAYLIYSASGLFFLFGIYRWRTAALRKRHKLLAILYAAAERFVPKAFLSLLGKYNIQDVKLGDSIETNLTVLFSDIRSYTTLAEQLKPSESYAFINSYWSVTAPIIDQHQGFISQYLGDGVMALFPKQPDDAVEAVLDMMDALDLFNAEQTKMGGHPISVGYGLSSGPAMLGTIGVKQRMDANVISNTSNLASRVESLNKFYGTCFLVSDLTFNSLSDPSKYTVRFVDKIKAKGMHNTVKLWEIYRRGPISDNERTFIEAYQNAFEKYETGDFQTAIAEFRRCCVLKPKDQSSVVMIARCESLIENGAPEGWEGVYEMLHK